MKTFTCVCGTPVNFQNTGCQHCGRSLGFLPDRLQLCALDAVGNGLFRVAPAVTADGAYRLCRNYGFEHVCNWLVAADDKSPYCRACRLNDTIPDLSVDGNRVRWRRLEQAKRRLLYTLLRLRLPLLGRDRNPASGLSFAFLADPAAGQTIFTGHQDGRITINVAEADDSQRERIRESLGERYRTVLGHLRHEIGHYYWGQLIDGRPWLEEFRQLFGDERAAYEESKKRHYERGAPPDWQTRFVSTYASMHPWEDWAETWAHYLHLTDTLETAATFDLSLRTSPVRMPELLAVTRLTGAPERAAFDRQLADWERMAICVNAINRSLGLPDPYPFVLSEPTHDKLYFIHRVLAQAAATRSEYQLSQGVCHE